MLTVLPRVGVPRWPRKIPLLFLSILMVFGPVGPSNAIAEDGLVRLATATSIVNSGLMEILGPKFEKTTGLRIKIISVGTGRALRFGREGEVDVVLVHAPEAEMEFVAAGHGINRQNVMHNDFVIVGPKDDPAGIKEIDDVIEVFQRIENRKTPFYSRGDDSGTHKKELALWKAAGTEPFGLWYREAGKGMAGTLEDAIQHSGYLLIDRGTWLKRHDMTRLALLVEGDKRLFNPYSVISINPAKHPNINFKGALVFINWITSREAKQLISAYKIDKEQLFVPATSSAPN